MDIVTEKRGLEYQKKLMQVRVLLNAAIVAEDVEMATVLHDEFVAIADEYRAMLVGLIAEINAA